MTNHETAIPTDRPVLAGVVLAAGLSSRMGSFKPLLLLGGKPVVAQVVESLAAARAIDPILVVTGHLADRVAGALANADVALVFNAAHAQGEMLSSIQAAVRALPPAVDAFVLALGDQPGIRPHTIRLLTDAWLRARAAIVIPTFDGRRGHPLIISSRCIPEILSLAPGQTLKSITARRDLDIVLVPVDDPAVRMDIDTPEDYQSAVRRWEQRPAACNGTEALHGPSIG